MTREPETDRELADALQRLATGTPVAPLDDAREAALLDAFERHHAAPMRRSTAGPWWIMALAAAAALLIAFGIGTGSAGRHGLTPPPGSPPGAHRAAVHRDVQPDVPTGEFIPWPGASVLPPLESGELVRMDLPVAMLPSLGVTPPAAQVTVVKADVIIGQDGLARAVRFVGN